jgi:hypothetical protein
MPLEFVWVRVDERIVFQRAGYSHTLLLASENGNTIVMGCQFHKQWQ